MSLSQILLPEFDEEMANTRKMIERIPDGQFEYQPHPKSMTLGRLASHVVELAGWGGNTLNTELLELQAGQAPLSMKTRQELLDTFDKNVQETRALIEKASDEDLRKIWTLKFDGKTVFSMPRIAVLRGAVMNHLIHHRAQLSVYLRMVGVEIPGMYGPSADEMKFWQAQSA
ncbi:MAG TPA: DinB family protein [Casimicrobiaceae bacterium]